MRSSADLRQKLLEELMGQMDDRMAGDMFEHRGTGATKNDPENEDYNVEGGKGEQSFSGLHNTTSSEPKRSTGSHGGSSQVDEDGNDSEPDNDEDDNMLHSGKSDIHRLPGGDTNNERHAAGGDGIDPRLEEIIKKKKFGKY